MSSSRELCENCKLRIPPAIGSWRPCDECYPKTCQCDVCAAVVAKTEIVVDYSATARGIAKCKTCAEHRPPPLGGAA